MPDLESMTLEEAGARLDELKEAITVEGLGEEEKAEIEKEIRALQDQIEVLSTRAYQAAREAARLDMEENAGAAPII